MIELRDMKFTHLPFDCYGIFIDDVYYGRFVDETRPNRNSLLILSEKYFTSEVLVKVANAVHEKFTDRQFKLLVSDN